MSNPKPSFDVKEARTLVVMTQPPSILSDALSSACDRIEFLEKENAELKRDFLHEPHDPMDSGFWGRACARFLAYVKTHEEILRDLIHATKRVMEFTDDRTVYRAGLREAARSSIESAERLLEKKDHESD